MAFPEQHNILLINKHFSDLNPVEAGWHVWEKYNFDKMFVGDDWKGTDRFKATEKQFKENGIDVEIVFFPYTQGVSTSALREELKK